METARTAREREAEPEALSIAKLLSGQLTSIKRWCRQHVASLLRFRASHVAFAQFAGATFLSAILDNNVVADFGGRALQGLQVNLIRLFSMAQIAGYAVGGCWTHIGSAQSVVAYAFIRKDIDGDFTPFQWIKMMTPVIIEIFVVAAVLIYLQAALGL